MQKKLLILAGAAVHVKLVLAAKEMGLYTIVTDNLPIDRSPAKRYADESWMISITDVASIIQRINEIGGVDGVIAYCIDPAQQPYYEICKSLKLPCYYNGAQLAIMTKKFEFSNGFTELHTLSYRKILSGEGFRISEARPCIEIVTDIRNSRPIGLVGDYHPLAKLPLTSHPFGWAEDR